MSGIGDAALKSDFIIKCSSSSSNNNNNNNKVFLVYWRAGLTAQPIIRLVHNVQNEQN
jgi:hypothetical protein